jgi:lipopolysaccharide/colanic/teichoic acid biosynthesis glycosyltransferase
MFYLYKTFIVLLILLSLPVMIGISILIVLTSGFPVFFFQKRTGRYGKEFTMYKFRTMVNGAQDMQSSLKRLNEADGPVFKIKKDPRLTTFGMFLNHTGLDELPQLFNVLFGTMALIGPRPLPLTEAKKLKPWQREREAILPGIISPWILNGYHQNTFDDWMKSDILYVKKKSLITDIPLLFRFIKFWVSLVARVITRTV